MSRNLTSDRSSMRAPFSEMLPVRLGVSILTRGFAAIAASRLTMGALEAAGVLGTMVAGNEGLDYAVIQFDPHKVQPVNNVKGFEIDGIGPSRLDKLRSLVRV